MEVEKVGVIGASGYSGQQLLRLLAQHPQVELACVTSRQEAGQTLGAISPSLRKQRIGRLTLIPATADAVVASGARTVFLALPHGLANEFAAPLLDAGLRVIDLSADFRIKDTAVYEEFYGAAHPAPALLARSVYGLPELYADQIRDAKLVAAPGCYPTSILIPLVPLLLRKLIVAGSIVIVSASGVSGAGRKAELPLLFVECNESARAYSIPKHRHLAEIEQELSAAAGEKVTVSFAPHLIPINRGIISTIHAEVRPGLTLEEVAAALGDAYAGAPFVRLLGSDEFPDIKNVAHTNFIDLGWQLDARTKRLVVLSAEDNLLKGAAGQAVQCLNLMCGWDETAGLLN